MVRTDTSLRSPVSSSTETTVASRAITLLELVPPSSGTLPTHGPLFVLLLVGTVLLVGALTFIPALALGPIVEHLQLHAER